ncbi:MAG: NUMOD4 domain-containing protein [Bacillota bacterium]|nr:NUMOD4 domain-containing protein [Bacillota bacterium]
MQETWKDVKGFGGRYQVSNYGRLRSLEMEVLCRNGKRRIVNGSTLKERINHKSGYVQYLLCMDGCKIYKYAHRLVAETFLANPENKPTINHKDENKRNNRIENLEWATYSENNTYNDGIKRRLIHTDIKKRTEKIDYKAKAEKQKKPIIQFDLCGNKIKKWDGAIDAARILKIDKGALRQCLYGKTKTSGGYIWRFA